MVLVVDDDRSVREALVDLFRSASMAVKAFASVDDFRSFRRPDVPTCLLLDVRLPGLSGLELQRELAAAGELLPIVFLTAFGDIPMAVRAIKAGAEEFITKPFREQELLEAVGRALERARVLRAKRTELAALRKRWGCLTSREREVVERLVRGRRNKEIAREFGRSAVTIKTHRRHILEKLGAKNLADLVRMSERLARSE
ncbi:MAG TPA: response regulator [Steroidobacteraceae bacterium]|nr:response regulator [Steroidobacteraceae bacterium]